MDAAGGRDRNRHPDENLVSTRVNVFHVLMVWAGNGDPGFAPTGIAPQSAVGTPTVSPSETQIAPTGIPPVAAVGSPEIEQDGLLPPTPPTRKRPAPRHEPPVWLLDLDLGGRVYHVAEHPIEVRGVQYDSGLSGIQLSTSGDALDEVDVEVLLGVDWARLASEEGLPVELGRAHLRRYWPAEDLTETGIRGEVSEPEYGAASEPLTLTIREAQESSPLTPPTWIVDDRTWPADHLTSGYSPIEQVIGQRYPIVIGKPGAARAVGQDVTVGAVPALLVSAAFTGASERFGPNTKALVSGGHIAATTARVWVLGDTITQNVSPVIHAFDALGQPVSLVEVKGTDHPGSGETPEVWVGLGVSEGGVQVGGRPIRGAGEVIEWVLRDGRQRVDWSRMAPVLSQLDRYLVDTWANDVPDRWAWLQAELLRLLPVVVLHSDQGLYLQIVRWDATERDAVAHLGTYRAPDVGPVVDRESRLLALREDVHNEIEVRYSLRFGHIWAGRRWATAEPGELSDGTRDDRGIWHPGCALSRSLYGPRVRPEPSEAGWVYDDATAVRIARDLAARYALPRRQVTYGGGWDLSQIQPWDVVTITDPEVSLYRRVALVSEVSYRETGVALTLILLASSGTIRPAGAS